MDTDHYFSGGSSQTERKRRFMMYTDGVNEATNSINQLFGKERILNVIDNNYNNTSSKINSELINSIRKFVLLNEQSDDITILTLKYIGNE